jgi:membrane protease YdiL (CAAX protease family)
MIPWRPVLVYLSIAVGATTAIAVLCASMGWTVNSVAWLALAPIAMWAPALGAWIARRTVDRGFTATLSLDRRGRTWAQLIFWPLAVPLCVYAAAYAVAWLSGLAHWNPGGGKWTTTGRIVANVVVNVPILAVVGTVTALGEEIGWRGYLQPRLDMAGVRWSVAVVWLCQLAYHAPLMVGAGYADAGSLPITLLLFVIGDLPVAFLWAHESYRSRTLWTAVFFHSFHNSISQWVFPKFFAGGDNGLWLGEGGILPVVGYVTVGLLFYVWMRRRGESWSALARRGLN